MSTTRTLTGSRTGVLAGTPAGARTGTLAGPLGGTLAGILTGNQPAITQGGTAAAAATGTGATRASQAGTWPYGPHAAAMLSFNQLPSRWLHASRWASLLPPGWPVPDTDDGPGHRHCSALLLRQLGSGAAPITDWQRPEWPLAVLPTPQWMQLLRRLGLMLVQPVLRQAIRGDQLRAAAAEFGDDDLAWVRQRAPRLPSALEGIAELPALAHLSAPLPQLAAALLAHATAAAPAAMRQRLALRAPVPAPYRPDVGATRAAWALTLTLLDELEPSWRSSFPGSR